MHPTHRIVPLLVLSLALSTVAGAQHPDSHDPRALAEDPRRAPGQIAPLLTGLGEHHFPITTSSERAQRFFDQGLKLTYGFNHQEALRAFKETARLDPDAAMAYWGWALVLGPNLNLPMTAEVVAQAHDAAERALDRAGGVSEKERGLIEALSHRYTDDPDADRAPYDAAYAERMGALHERFPEDDDIATLYAAALMNLSPWSYWTVDGRPREPTPRILSTLEAVLERDPHHEGALHYYIHAVEPVDAARGEWAADQLRGLAPGAGHLVHMPSHIYMQVGRYAEAYEANALASEADAGYITQCRVQGIYPLTYYPHNLHFLAWAAMMEGRADAALEASRQVAAQVPGDPGPGEGHGDHQGDHQSDAWALFQTFLSMPLSTLARFGRWDDVLAQPRPAPEKPYHLGLWHWARGLAFVHTDRPAAAARELSALAALVDDPATLESLVGFSNASALLTIARQVLAGEVAARQGDHDAAVAHLDKAVRYEDSLRYNEPPSWPYPVRHTLGAVLLEAGRPLEAAVVYIRDLETSPENGYALFGLRQALAALGQSAEAAEVERRFRESWKNADVTLTSSRF